jgi:hypothetical protein
MGKMPMIRNDMGETPMHARQDCEVVEFCKLEGGRTSKPRGSGRGLGLGSSGATKCQTILALMTPRTAAATQSLK